MQTHRLGGDVAQLVRASDHHAADKGSIPWCCKGFFFPGSIFSADSFTCVRTPLCAIACINIGVHVKDPVVHVRLRWIMETLTHSECTVGWGARLCRSWLSPGKKTTTEFPMGEIQMGQCSCKKTNKQKNTTFKNRLQF